MRAELVCKSPLLAREFRRQVASKAARERRAGASHAPVQAADPRRNPDLGLARVTPTRAGRTTKAARGERRGHDKIGEAAPRNRSRRVLLAAELGYAIGN